MKKSLSVALAVLMVLCMIPVTALANTTVTFDKSGEFLTSDQLKTDNDYIIPDGVQMAVPSGLTLYIPTGAKLLVKPGGKLLVNGNIVALPGSELKVQGHIINAGNVSGSGDCTAEIRFPSLKDAGLDGLNAACNKENKIEVAVAFSKDGSKYEDIKGDLVFNKISDEGGVIYAPLNQNLFIRANIVEPDKKYDKYDDSLMGVYLNGQNVAFKSTGVHATEITKAGDITYTKWVTNEYFFNTFNIYLPKGEGYTVYGREGEQSVEGETVRLKYGQPFSFKVEIDPKFDMSSYEVYIYNGYGWTNLDTETLLKDIEPAKPDKYGYYNIPEVKGEHTIYVVGVVKNETLLLIGDIFDMIRNVFDMISNFFREFMGIFGITV